MNQVIFAFLLFVTFAFLLFTLNRIKGHFNRTKAMPFDGRVRERINLTFKVALGQSKILRKPVVGLIHALVFWGFIVITIGSLEMIVDGFTGLHRSFAALGVVYNIISACGDVFAYIVLLGVIIFLFRRLALPIKRFKGIEVKTKNKMDANIALSFILLLMLSLVGMNIFDLLLHKDGLAGVYPFSSVIAGSIDWNSNDTLAFQFFWYLHIILIFAFANYLPYSKHFHVFMSLPNVFFSNLNPLSYLPSMPEVRKEVQLMMSGDAYSAPAEESPSRFGVKDVEDVSWKNYLDALTCTQCGRCTEVCPANITGKTLSPRKIFVDLRSRMDEKGRIKKEDAKALVGNYISKEELWACTTCNACAQECPLNISHPNLIVDMRRYLVLEEGDAPEELNAMFANIENNGAPWKYSPEDRLKWTEG